MMLSTMMYSELTTYMEAAHKSFCRQIILSFSENLRAQALCSSTFSLCALCALRGLIFFFAPSRLCVRLFAFVAVCLGGCVEERSAQTVVDFWAIGSEGERVEPLIREFERENPTLRVRLQQIPWLAAHEKLLTAFAGDATPDVCQLGNTWIPEFAMLGALAPLDNRVAKSAVIDSDDYFPGVWETNRMQAHLYGVPWYADTRLLFYRRDLLAQAGWPQPPETWSDWRACMREVKQRAGPDRYALLVPTNEWEQPTIFGLQTGSEMLRDDGRYGNFQSAEFRRAFEFYVSLFSEGWAPPLQNTEVSNVWEEFARGYFAMYVTGPWNIGEFRRRLPAELEDEWSTAPLPRPDGAEHSISQAGGCGLVLFQQSRNKDAAWKLIEFLSRPESLVEFYRLTGNLPPRESAWQQGRLEEDPRMRAFHEQLEHAAPLPRVPEWEQITKQIIHAGQATIAGKKTIDEALADLDRSVNALLEKRRWILAQRAAAERE
jgi:multiple sugar transport system substrate-binding protein